MPLWPPNPCSVYTPGSGMQPVCVCWHGLRRRGAGGQEEGTALSFTLSSGGCLCHRAQALSSHSLSNQQSLSVRVLAPSVNLINTEHFSPPPSVALYSSWSIAATGRLPACSLGSGSDRVTDGMLFPGGGVEGQCLVSSKSRRGRLPETQEI